MESLCLFNFGLRSRIKNNSKTQTIKLVRTLPQDPKVLCDFSWLVSMMFSYVVADCRLPILYAPPHVDVGVACKADIICITQITFKEIYNVLLVDNWRYIFLCFKLILDLVPCKDMMYFGIYLSAKITKLLA